MRAIAYIRVSTQKQDDKYGKEAQEQAIREYAEANGYDIVEWFEEVGCGAEERPVINSIVNGELTTQPYEAVIVFKNDRVARETKMYFYYLYQLEKRGIKLVSTQEEYDEGSAIANIYLSILQFVAEQERKNITLRTSNGRKVKAKNGGYAGGGVPFGYKVVNSELEIEQNEAETVRLIFHLNSVGYSYNGIAEVLAQRGIATRKGQYFTKSGVRSIIDNRRFYEGFYRYGTQGYVMGKHKALFEKQDYHIDYSWQEERATLWEDT